MHAITSGARVANRTCALNLHPEPVLALLSRRSVSRPSHSFLLPIIKRLIDTTGVLHTPGLLPLLPAPIGPSPALQVPPANALSLPTNTIPTPLQSPRLRSRCPASQPRRPTPRRSARGPAEHTASLRHPHNAEPHATTRSNRHSTTARRRPPTQPYAPAHPAPVFIFGSFATSHPPVIGT